ncbi:hypothetical protein J3A83DRAFT_4398788 [Scleroderma citrinum]
MSAFHLRPVADHGSSSPPSTTPIHPTTLRRPLSPSSLRELNLSQDASSAPRKYPAPPTGHELMALFPAPRPADLPELRQGSTSGFFQRQERAFFAQAGREVLRVRLEIDSADAESHAKPPTVARTWPQLPPHPQHHSPAVDSPYTRTKQSRSMPGPPPSSAPPTNTTVNMYPVPSPSSSSPHAIHGAPPPPQPPVPMSSPPTHHLHHPSPPPHGGAIGLHTPPHDHHHAHLPPVVSKMEFQPQDDYREDVGGGGGGAGGPDEAWRRPTPHADRRRAGKHTKRMIVRI